MARKAVHAFVSGLVQGVGYRYFTERVAREYGLVGYVKNLVDGRVEVFAEGEEEVLQDFLITLRKGPMMARVDDIETHWQEPTGKYRDFRIEFY